MAHICRRRPGSVFSEGSARAGGSETSTATLKASAMSGPSAMRRVSQIRGLDSACCERFRDSARDNSVFALMTAWMSDCKGRALQRCGRTAQRRPGLSAAEAYGAHRVWHAGTCELERRRLEARAHDLQTIAELIPIAGTGGDGRCAFDCGRRTAVCRGGQRRRQPRFPLAHTAGTRVSTHGCWGKQSAVRACVCLFVRRGMPCRSARSCRSAI